MGWGVGGRLMDELGGSGEDRGLGLVVMAKV